MPCPPRIGLCSACGLMKGAANQEPPSDLGMVSLTPPRGLACAIFPNGRDVSNRASNAPSFALRTAYQPQFSPLFLRGRITDLRAGTHRDGPSSGDGVHGDIRPRPPEPFRTGPSTCRVVAFYGRPRWLRSGMARPKSPKSLSGRSSFILAFISLHLALGSRRQRDNEDGRYLAGAPRLVSCQCWTAGVSHMTPNHPAGSPGVGNQERGHGVGSPRCPMSRFPAPCDWRLR